jgi:hypothetical protein
VADWHQWQRLPTGPSGRLVVGLLRVTVLLLVAVLEQAADPPQGQAVKQQREVTRSQLGNWKGLA